MIAQSADQLPSEQFFSLRSLRLNHDPRKIRISGFHALIITYRSRFPGAGRGVVSNNKRDYSRRGWGYLSSRSHAVPGAK